MLVTAQFYDNKSGTMTPPQEAVVQAPFYKKATRTHPDYNALISSTIEKLAEGVGLSGQRPVVSQVLRSFKPFNQ
jgi:hypothetical protein